MSLNSVDKSLLFTRNDSQDPRLGERVNTGTTNGMTWSLIGYPDDEGISKNGGRPGSKEGPNEIRRALYKMTPGLSSSQLNILDLGNIDVQALPTLNDRHLFGQQQCLNALNQGHRWIGLGGGHDYGYSEGSAFLKHFAGQSPLILHFDAHLDVRPMGDTPHSGTPFRRLLEEFDQFTLLAIGIQSQCNAQAHLDFFKSFGHQCLLMDDILTHPQGASQAMIDFVSTHLSFGRPTFLSLDMDVFSSAQAPGCSQSWPIGLMANDIAIAIDIIAQRTHLAVTGIYETSPPLDIDNRTAKLAAQIIHRILSRSKGRP